MDPGSGRIYQIENYDQTIHADPQEPVQNAMKRGHVIIPPDQLAGLKKASIPRRKGWARNQPCPCGSTRKFKLCCWHKYA